MKQHLTFTYFLLLIVSLVLILGDCPIHKGTISKNLTPIHKECSNQSDLLADSHLGSFEDEEVATVSKAKSYKSCPYIGLIAFSGISFKSFFTTNIWQPPKLS
jgi:hypothetical protein